MDRHGYRTSVPACDPASLEPKPLLDLTSGYVVRAATNLPKQASVKPWFIRQNYILDMLTMKRGKLDDGILQFATHLATIPTRSSDGLS
jgi:monooxygenase